MLFSDVELCYMKLGYSSVLGWTLGAALLTLLFIVQVSSVAGDVFVACFVAWSLLFALW